MELGVCGCAGESRCSLKQTCVSTEILTLGQAIFAFNVVLVVTSVHPQQVRPRGKKG